MSDHDPCGREGRWWEAKKIAGLDVVVVPYMPKDEIWLLWVDREGKPKAARIVNIGAPKQD